MTSLAPQSSDPAEAPVYRKARPDLYTLLLVIALMAILVAIFVLWAYNKEFNYDFKGGPPTPQAAWQQNAQPPAPSVEQAGPPAIAQPLGKTWT